jgi:hypothetical protein
VFVTQLKGLEHSLEQAVTEFLLRNLIGFVEMVGLGPGAVSWSSMKRINLPLFQSLQRKNCSVKVANLDSG